MRNRFREFYKPTNEEINDFWENAIFSFDANILLNLYRYTENTRSEILETLEYLSENDRLWISYQAAFEYQKNRLIVIDSLKKAYDNLKENLSKRKSELETDLNSYKRHPYLKADELKEKLNESFSVIDEQLNALKDEHPDFFDEDPIFDRLTEIFEDCIGDSFTTEELANIYKEGKERYEKKIPPGYMDKKDKENSGEQSLYGDLIIWKELLRRLSGNQDKIIFVTDDLKEDWWHIFNGKTIYPRPELIREFIKITGKEILIYKPEQFLHFANSKLMQEVNEDTLHEVEQVRKHDESYFDLSKILNINTNTPLVGYHPYYVLNEAGQQVLANPNILGINEFGHYGLLGGSIYGKINPHGYGITEPIQYLTGTRSIYGTINPSNIVATPLTYGAFSPQQPIAYPTAAQIVTELMDKKKEEKTSNDNDEGPSKEEKVD